jgi:hypothetical protein
MLVTVHMNLGRMCNLLAEGVIYYIHWNLTDVESSCVITDYMPGRSVHFREWIVEVSSCAVGSSFSCSSNNAAFT